MEKRRISFIAHPLKWACNEMYHAAARLLPQACYQTPGRRQATAFVEGIVAGYAAAALGKHAVYPLTFQQAGVSLDDVITFSLGATLGTPVVSRLVAPEAYARWAADNPVYKWGVAGVMAGASVKAIEELIC